MDIDVFQINQRKYSFELVNKAKLENDLIFNIILLGDSGVGKSSFSLKALKNEFTEQSDENFQISTYYLNNTDSSYYDIIKNATNILDNYYKNEKELIYPLVNTQIEKFYKLLGNCHPEIGYWEVNFIINNK